MRSLKTVMKSCGKNSSLQLWTACCVKTKKISRYELKLSGLSLTQTSFSVEHELLSGPFYFQWCHGLQCPLPGVQFRCSIVVPWCWLGQLGHSMSFRCWAKRAQVLCPMGQPHMDVLDAFGHLLYHEAHVVAIEWCPRNHPMECQDEIPPRKNSECHLMRDLFAWILVLWNLCCTVTLKDRHSFNRKPG